MADPAKSRCQLVRELAAARQRIARLEAAVLKNTRIQATQHQVLESMARGRPLHHALAALVRTIEGQCPGVIASVLLLDKDREHLRHGAAPGLPEAYSLAVDGVRIGPNVGSCGTAAYRGEQVTVSDIEHDPLWADFRDLALRHNLRACWSQPIFSFDHRVLGTLAMYYSRPQVPTEADRDYIEVAAFLAGIAIERSLSDEVGAPGPALSGASRVSS